MLPDAHLLLVGASLALSAAIAATTWRDARFDRSTRWLLVALVASGAAYSLLPAPLGPEWPPAWRALWRLLAAPGAALLWLTIRRLFDDDFRLRRRHAAGLAVLALLGGLAGLGGAAPDAAALATWAGRALTAASLALALHLLWRLLAGRGADLDPTRRPVRLLLAGLGSGYVVVALLGGTGQLGTLLVGVQVAAKLAWIVLMTPAAAPGVRWLTPPPPLPRAAPAPTSAEPTAQQQLASRVRQALEQEHLFRRTGLTIGDLALHLGCPEHRLRRVIHDELAQRNFNSFLNAYRLREVAARLTSAEEAETSITALALDAGFASLGPFNRAFRDAFGCTPSEYRRSPPRADS